MSANDRTAIELCEDADLLEREPELDKVWPRKHMKTGEPNKDWGVQRRLSVDEIARRLRARKTDAEPMEFGRLSMRSRANLRPCSTCFSLHYIYIAADSAGDETGYFARKARHYLSMAEDYLEMESLSLDYDSDDSGDIDDWEKNRPFPTRFIRG